LHHMFLVRMNPGIKIVNVPDYKDWYNSYDIEDEKSYWNRYKFYLSYFVYNREILWIHLTTTILLPSFKRAI